MCVCLCVIFPYGKVLCTGMHENKSLPQQLATDLRWGRGEKYQWDYFNFCEHQFWQKTLPSKDNIVMISYVIYQLTENSYYQHKFY